MEVVAGGECCHGCRWEGREVEEMGCGDVSNGPVCRMEVEGSDGGDVFESGAPMPSPSLFLWQSNTVTPSILMRMLI